MSKQWTSADPGAGSTGSLRSLQSKLTEVFSELEFGQSQLKNAKEVFKDSWTGKSATAAARMVVKLDRQIETLSSAAQGVRQAVSAYADEVSAIKNLAKIQIAKRNAAFEEINDALVTSPNAEPQRFSQAAADRDEAIGELLKLATRRQEADTAVLVGVRAVLATTWEIAPEDYPEDRGWTNGGSYDYSMDHPLGFRTDQYTAKELMDFFKSHPGEVFPFPVSGTSNVFEDGAIFTLEDTLIKNIPLPFETGQVVVTTTDTSVKFTVVSDTYFDGPGSTIEFSIVEVDGQYVLRKVAHATDVTMPVHLGAETGAGATWEEQAENLKRVVEKYGK